MAGIEKEIQKMPFSTFKNEHGEIFKVHFDGVFCLLSGDEISAMIDDDELMAGKYIPLFNQSFNIYSTNELILLGNALIEVAQKVRK